jgi:hypothetical protein
MIRQVYYCQVNPFIIDGLYELPLDKNWGEEWAALVSGRLRGGRLAPSATALGPFGYAQGRLYGSKVRLFEPDLVLPANGRDLMQSVGRGQSGSSAQSAPNSSGLEWATWAALSPCTD